MQEAEIDILCKLADNLIDLDVYAAWECLCDYAVDFIDDIENPSDWFESLYDSIREIKLTLDAAHLHFDNSLQ
jgi:hypothetical protein